MVIGVIRVIRKIRVPSSFFYYHYLKSMSEPINAITLPPAQNPQQEGEWLQKTLEVWLDSEFLPESTNQEIAQRATQIYVRQRMEGENDLGSLVIAIVTEMRGFDFSKSFYGEFAIANAVSDLLLDSLGIDRCCGQ
jgi:hypothetical protein